MINVLKHALSTWLPVCFGHHLTMRCVSLPHTDSCALWSQINGVKKARLDDVSMLFGKRLWKLLLVLSMPKVNRLGPKDHNEREVQKIVEWQKEANACEHA
eukprot:1950947-Amphidinium_carterae.1